MSEELQLPIDKFERYYQQSLDYALAARNRTRDQLEIDQAAFEQASEELFQFQALKRKLASL